MSDPEEVIRAAEKVTGVLESSGVGALVIGAVALAAADTVIRSRSRQRIVPLPHLVALKLYAEGTKPRADIVELLARNPDARSRVHFSEETSHDRPAIARWRRMGGVVCAHTGSTAGGVVETVADVPRIGRFARP